MRPKVWFSVFSLFSYEFYFSCYPCDRFRQNHMGVGIVPFKYLLLHLNNLTTSPEVIKASKFSAQTLQL